MAGVKGQRSGGHNAKSTREHRRAGTYRRDRHEKRGETGPTPDPYEPIRPDWLDGHALEQWDSVTTALRKLGILSRTDAAMIELTAVTYAEWRAVVARGEPGKQYVTMLRSLFREFGLSPSSRSGVKVEPLADESQNPFVQLARINSGDES